MKFSTRMQLLLTKYSCKNMVCIRICMWHVLSQLLARDLKHLTQNCCLQADEPMECLQEEQAALHMASLSWFYFLEIILQALFKGEGARLKTGATGCHTIELNLPKIPNSTHRLSWCKQPHLTQETRAVKEILRVISWKQQEMECHRFSQMQI